MSEVALREAERESRLEAAPFAIGVALGLAALAAVSANAGWELLDGVGWWLWVATTAAWGVLGLTFVLGLGRVPRRDVRRKIAGTLLVVVVTGSLVQTALLVAALMSSSNGITGPQLLQSGATLWLANVVAFGLVFWEVDCGGPVDRAMASRREAPDFAFPQDDNPDLARPDWSPHLVDYLYVALSNSIAFSPTDTMPLTRRAKAGMALGSFVSAITVLLIAARAINILG